MTSIKRKIPGLAMSIVALLFFIQTAKSQVKKDTLQTQKKEASNKTAGSIRPYKEIINDSARTQASFYKVHTVKDKYYFEIPDSMLGKDVLTVTRIDKGAVGAVIPFLLIGYSGDEFGRSVITFEKIPGDRLVMRSIKFDQIVADTSNNGLARSYINNNVHAIEAVFPVKAYNKLKGSTVIDVTDFLSGKGMIGAFIPPLPIFGDIFAKLIPERSYIDNIKAFPESIEIVTTKTLTGTSTAVTMDLNTSLVLLPSNPMKPRQTDPRVGYLWNKYVDFDVNPFGVGATKYIQRWRMEPKEEDEGRYLKGELVEPKKPIVIYIDPATPKKWVPYLIAGINDWQVAFEKAGFRNAIMGKEAPINDSAWSMLDSRHSMLIYKPSNVPNASGPNVNDPRTGEILETHINWYHSVMTLIKSWYTIQAGAIDPAARKPELDDETMGQLIRFVSSHEVGHTLGLMHNFGASSTVPVEKLRDKAWVEANGHTPSIMDYARFNYVAQPEDNIGRKGIFPRIGAYDKWAIEWGYKWLPQFKTAAEERPFLNKWIIEKLTSGKQYFYGSQLQPLTNEFPLSDMDPRSQSEDLGDDAVLASTYGIKNLKRILPQLMEWTRKPNENYENAATLYGDLVGEYGRFMGHVLKNIGGVYVTPTTVEQAGPQLEAVPKEKQQRAMSFLNKQLFETPYWLMDNKLYLVSTASFNSVTRLQESVLNTLLGAEMISKLISYESDFPGKGYPAAEMLKELKAGIFSEMYTHKAVSTYRQALQNSYVEALVQLLVSNQNASTLSSVVKAHAREIAVTIKRALPQTHDTVTRQHLEDMYERLDVALQRKNIINIPPPAKK